MVSTLPSLAEDVRNLIKATLCVHECEDSNVGHGVGDVSWGGGHGLGRGLSVSSAFVQPLLKQGRPIY